MAKKSTEKEFTITDEITLTCYDWGERKSAKITILESFVIFCKIIEKGDKIFISYPQYKNKDGDYKSLAYCFDKKLIKKINSAVESFCE